MGRNDEFLIDEYEHRETGKDVPHDFPYLAVSIISQVELLMKLEPTMSFVDRAWISNRIDEVLGVA